MPSDRSSRLATEVQGSGAAVARSLIVPAFLPLGEVVLTVGTAK